LDKIEPRARRLAKRLGFTAMLVGLYALFIGGWPVWVTDLRID